MLQEEVIQVALLHLIIQVMVELQDNLALLAVQAALV
jgi:hypothetical protein